MPGKNFKINDYGMYSYLESYSANYKQSEFLEYDDYTEKFQC